MDSDLKRLFNEKKKLIAKYNEAKRLQEPTPAEQQQYKARISDLDKQIEVKKLEIEQAKNMEGEIQEDETPSATRARTEPSVSVSSAMAAPMY